MQMLELSVSQMLKFAGKVQNLVNLDLSASKTNNTPKKQLNILTKLSLIQARLNVILPSHKATKQSREHGVNIRKELQHII